MTTTKTFLPLLCAFVLVGTFFMIASSSFVSADSVDVIAGHIYYSNLEANSPSSRWSGITVTTNGADFDESNLPFGSIQFVTPEITPREFPGDNLDDGIHYFAAMFDDSFNLTRVHNVTSGDLDPEEMFSSVDFPIFYPDYSSSFSFI